ncbi:flavodoxin [Pseudomonas aeruginosa]
MKVAILSGSVYGTAEEVARHAQKLLSAAGLEASHLPRASLDELKAFAPEAFLVVTSTTGMGELPDNLQPLYYAIRDQLPAWHGLPGGVIGLGDSSYGDTFCGGGEQVRELFGELGVREVLPMLRLDASETGGYSPYTGRGQAVGRITPQALSAETPAEVADNRVAVIRPARGGSKR